VADVSVAFWLVTRFNVYKARFRDELTPSAYEQWCRRRVELFRAITLPSVMAQNSQRFRWLIVMDTETNQTLDDFIKSLEEIDNIDVLRVDLRDQPAGAMQQAIAEHVMSKRLRKMTHVCTTRLDSDDAIHFGFVRSLRRAVYTGEVELSRKASVRVIFPYVASWNGQDMRVGIYPRNHFANLVEPVGRRIKTIYAFNHLRKRANDVLLHPKPPMALTSVHDTNVWNAMKETDAKLAEPQPLLDSFGLGEAAIRELSASRQSPSIELER
jgi:hypothetical protein